MISIYGGDDNDLILGDWHEDLIYGGDGQDTMLGGSGNDTLDGQTGVDRLVADAGHDDLFGGDSNDTMYASTGADKSDGGLGDDWTDLDAGSDWAIYTVGFDTIRAGSGNDYIDVTNATDDKLILSVAKGFGHDQIAGSNNRVDKVIFESISSSDAELVWNWTSQQIGNQVFMSGEAAIRIKSTGDTIYLQSLSGQYTLTGIGPDYPSMGHNFDPVFSDRTVSAGSWDFFFDFPWEIPRPSHSARVEECSRKL